MAANSPLRKMIKKLIHPFMDERYYKYLQSIAMSWDIHQGKWYEPELDLLPYAIRSGESVVDVGANYGLYCDHLSKQVGPSGRVFAFEPVPFTVSTLRLVQKIRRWKNVTIFDKGASNEAGSVEFMLPLQVNGAPAAGLAHRGGRDNDRPGKDKQIRYPAERPVRCELVRIDDVLPPGAEISFIKLDIEGAELAALEGADKMFARDKPSVIIEINIWYLEGFGVKLEQLLGFFEKHGYERYWFDDKQRKLVQVTTDKIIEDNYLFVHPRRKDRFASLL